MHRHGISNINSDAILFMLIDVCFGGKDTHVYLSSVHQNPHRICRVRIILTERRLSYTPTQRTYKESNAFLNGIIYHFPTISISMQNLSTHKIMNKQLTKETQTGISWMFLTWFSAFPFWIFCSEHVWTFAMYTFFWGMLINYAHMSFWWFCLDLG